MMNHNFPDGLDIQPLVLRKSSDDDIFDMIPQEKAILQYGIAGRVW